MEYIIREIEPSEYGLLEDFLYEAIFVPEGEAPPSRDVLKIPEISLYIDDFGTRKDDICFVAIVDGKPAGAVWVRDMEDYGHIAPGVPSFAIALYPDFRGCGIGTSLMRKMLAELKDRGYERTSLSVQKANYALRLYRKVGFEVYADHGEEYIMVCELAKTDPV